MENRIFITLLFSYLITSIAGAQDFGNVIDFEEKRYQSHVFAAEWKSDDEIILAISKNWYIFNEKEPEILKIDTDGNILGGKSLVEINGISNQTILYFKCNNDCSQYMMVTNNEVHDSLSQINLMILDESFHLLKDTSFLNIPHEVLWLVNGKYDEESDSFYGCGQSNIKRNLGFPGTEFYFSYSETNNKDTIIIKPNLSGGTSPTTDLIKTETGYAMSISNGLIYLLDEDFNVLKQSDNDKKGFFIEGVNIYLFIDSLIYLHSGQVFQDFENQYSSSISVFDLETNYIRDHYTLIGNKGEGTFARKSMVIKNGFVYSGLFDLQDLFTDVNSFRKYFRITKLDLELNEIWNVKFKSEESWFFEPTGLAVSEKGDVLAYGRIDQYETHSKTHYYPFMYLINPEGDVVSTIEIEEKDIGISIFPNPVSKEISICTDHLYDLNFDIYNMSGEIVKSFIHDNTQGNYDVSTLVPGLYYWVAKDKHKIVKTGKLEKI